MSEVFLKSSHMNRDCIESNLSLPIEQGCHNAKNDEKEKSLSNL